MAKMIAHGITLALKFDNFEDGTSVDNLATGIYHFSPQKHMQVTIKIGVYMLKRGLVKFLIIGFIVVNSIGVALADDDTADSLKISSEITGEKRMVIADIMSSLDVEDRENVIYFSDKGKVYANKPELKEGIMKWHNIKGNLYKNSDGKLKAFPSDKNTTTNKILKKDNDGGHYRRVTSKRGYSWTTSYVHLAGGREVSEEEGDTAYVYTGGNSDANIEIDAGLQHSPKHDDWAFYLLVEGKEPYTDIPRFKSKQNVFMKFYVPQNNKVALVVTGYDVYGEKRTITYTTHAPGWKKNGSGCNLKRCTTIAQKVEDFDSGSYHTNVHWYNCRLGTSSTSNHRWLENDNGPRPTCFPDKKHVKVDFKSPSEETVNIYCY